MSDEIVLKRTTVLLNAKGLPTRRGRETLVITGSERGATSLAAYVYRCAGLDLGNDLDAQIHEDRDLHATLANGGLDDWVAGRNARHLRWGFKLPSAVNMLVDLEHKLRNPVFVIVYRNPLTIGRTIINRDPDRLPRKVNLLWGINHGLRRLNAATEACKDLQSPVALVNIDAALSDAPSLVREMLEIIWPQVDDDLVERIAADIATPGYKKALPPVSAVR